MRWLPRFITSRQKCLLNGIVFLALFAMPSAYAERMLFNDPFQHNKKVEHQLSGVNQILQDTQGFMWFGCEKGLARFDGVETRVYGRNPDDPYSLPGEFVRNLLIDQDGFMWVGTDAGVCYYDATLDRFECGTQNPQMLWPEWNVHALAMDRDNTIYIGTTSGVYAIAPDRKSFRQLPLIVPGFQGLIGVSSLALDQQGIIWIGTYDSGVISYDPKTDQQRHFPSDPKRTDVLVHHKISSLSLDKQDRLWVGTYGGGVSVLSADRKSFKNYQHSPNDPKGLASNVIWDIYTDSAGDVWLAVDQGGLVRYNSAKGFTVLRHKPYDTRSLGPNQVRTIYQDSEGDLWIGAFPSGVNYHNSATRRIRTYKHQPDNPLSLSHNAILDIFKDARGEVWIGTEDGMNHFDPATETFTRYLSSSQTGLAAKAVLSLAQFDDNTLWVGTWSDGLFAFDLTTKTFRRIDTSPADGVGHNSLFIWDILRDRNGNMWIGTEFDGAAFYDRATGQFRYFSLDSMGARDMPDNFVRDLMEDRNGTIWMATKRGIGQLAPGQTKPNWIAKSSAPNGLQGELVFALYEDRYGRVWVATHDNGAFVYDPSTQGFTAIGAQLGLSESMSSGFVEDLHGFVWIFTTNGIVRVDEVTYEPKVFGAENGLTSNTFNRNAALRHPNGFISIGGADGLNTFDPADLELEPPKFPVRITGMRIMNRDVKVSEPNSPLLKAINFTPTIELHHQDTMFAFDFAALYYRHPQDIQYAYFLQGFDDDWNYVGTNRSATYTNISPGKYKFRVKASVGTSAVESDWAESGDILIVIKPAPWQSWWAYLLYSLVVLTIGYFCAHYFRLRGHTQVYKTLSAMDVMTGVANRAGITQAARALFENRQGQSLCVAFMDIDHFKTINDTRGHDSGDRVLVEVAEVFRQCLRQSDLIGRWGGEEFVLVLAGVDRADALHVAEKIRQQVAERGFDVERSPLRVTVSLGLAFAAPGESFESAVNRADQALYQAKGSGRNCVVAGT